MAEEDFDDLLISLKTKLWNYLHFFTVSIYFFIIPSAILAGAFLAPNIAHQCLSYPGNQTVNDNSLLNSDDCSMSYNVLNAPATNETTEKVVCTDWSFDNADFNNTLTSEFNLVCDRAYLRPTFHTLYMVGNIVGGPFQGLLADRFGRRIVLVGGVALMMATCIISSFMTHMVPILIARFMCGLAHPAITCAGYILCMEVCEPKYRSTVGVLVGVPWALGTVWFGFLGYFIRDWRWLQRACVAMAVIFLPMLLGCLNESPRWLIVKGHHKRALEILKVAYKQNNVQPPTDEDLMLKITQIYNSKLSGQSNSKSANEEVEKVEATTAMDVTNGSYDHNEKNKENNETNGSYDHNEKNKQNNVSNEISKEKSSNNEIAHGKNPSNMAIKLYRRATLLYSGSEIRKRTVLVHSIFVVSGTVFYGLSLNAINFGVNPYFYMAIGGLMEIPAYTCPVPIIAKFGRIRPTTLSFIITGITILALAFISPDIKWLVIVLAMCGKLCISASYQVAYVIASEVFPTEVRVVGLGIGSLCSKIGSATSPFVTDAAGAVLAWLPSLIFGCLSLLGAIVCWFIPETVDVHLPDTIEELEEKSKRDKIRKNNLEREIDEEIT